MLRSVARSGPRVALGEAGDVRQGIPGDVVHQVPDLGPVVQVNPAGELRVLVGMHVALEQHDVVGYGQVPGIDLRLAGIQSHMEPGIV